MKTNLVLISFALALAGCATTPTPPPDPGPLVLEVAVQAAVTYGTEKHPDAIPYLKAADAVVCKSAASGTLNPQDVIAAIESNVPGALATPDAKLIFNAAFVFYDAAFAQYSASKDMRPYLQAVCQGMALALPAADKLPVTISVPHLQ